METNHLLTDWYYALVILWKESHVFSTNNTNNTSNTKLTNNAKQTHNKFSYNGSILFEPAKKIPKSEYVCSNRFSLDTILEMYKSETVFGIVLISGKEARMYEITLSGSHKDIKLLYDRNISLAGRTRRGGQSALRIDRLIEEKRNIYLTEISETMAKVFLTNNNTDCIVKDMVIAGPANIKKELYNKELVQQFFAGKIKKFVNTDNIHDGTVWEVFDKSLDVFTTKELDYERNITEEVKQLVLDCDDKLVFGYDEVMALYNDHILSKLIIINNEELFEQVKQNNQCGCEIIHCVYNLQEYGQVVGIRWY